MATLRSIASLVRRCVAATALLAAALSPAAASADGFSPLAGFGDNPGNLLAWVYRPERPASPPALVVVLHGCTETGRSFAREAGWTDLADRFGWVLLAPEQQFGNNGLLCFNWFDPAQATRGRGEARSIDEMVEAVAAHDGIGTERTFVTGLSAGGAMAAVMLATYPERFAGGGIVAGVAYRCATSVPDAYRCMNPGRDLSPAALAKRVAAAAPKAARRPTLSIWQGTGDRTVVPSNAHELAEQWTEFEGIDRDKARVATLPHGLRRTTYPDAAGRPAVEVVLVRGMGHLVPIDPGTGPETCGTPGGFTAEIGVCAALSIARFWDLAPQ
jgi:poly(hydroxyalkanoate) depolymerase family esterase